MVLNSNLSFRRNLFGNAAEPLQVVTASDVLHINSYSLKQVVQGPVILQSRFPRNGYHPASSRLEFVAGWHLILSLTARPAGGLPYNIHERGRSRQQKFFNF